jgi:hypothetical protein
MSWEIFNRKVIRTVTPSIGVSREGRVNLNKGVTQRLKAQAVEFVLLLWDGDRHKIGLRPITKRDQRAFRVLYGKRENSSGLFAKSFFDYIGYNYSENRNLPAEWNDDEEMFEISIPHEALKPESIKQGVLVDTTTKRLFKMLRRKVV